MRLSFTSVKFRLVSLRAVRSALRTAVFRCVCVLAKQMFMAGLCMRCAHVLSKLNVRGRCMCVLAVLEVCVLANGWEY